MPRSALIVEENHHSFWSEEQNAKGLHRPSIDVPSNTFNPATANSGGIWGEETARSSWDCNWCGLPNLPLHHHTWSMNTGMDGWTVGGCRAALQVSQTFYQIDTIDHKCTRVNSFIQQASKRHFKILNF